MTLSTTTQRNEYTSTGQSSFSFTFRILAKADLLVYVDGVLKTLDTHYTIPNADVNDPAGGDITFTGGNIPDSGATIILLRSTAKTQETDLAEGYKFPAETLEQTHDKGMMVLQDLQEAIGRAIKFSATSLYDSVDMPDPVEGKFLKWVGGALMNVDVEGGGGGGGDLNIDHGSAAPTSGTWGLGWVRFNTNPAAGGNAGWICVVAGTPGTWKPFGLISE